MCIDLQVLGAKIQQAISWLGNYCIQALLLFLITYLKFVINSINTFQLSVN